MSPSLYIQALSFDKCVNNKGRNHQKKIVYLSISNIFKEKQLLAYNSE